MDTWKVITDISQLTFPGIYQEKFIIIDPDPDGKLKLMCVREYPEAEPCEVPTEILERFPYAFGYWVNKHDPKVNKKDIKARNLRIKI